MRTEDKACWNQMVYAANRVGHASFLEPLISTPQHLAPRA